MNERMLPSTFLGILGYADDNFLIAPSKEALQEMIDTCQEYAENHNLVFSTNPDPAKSKTKCLAFLKKNRHIEKLQLGENSLPRYKSYRNAPKKKRYVPSLLFFKIKYQCTACCRQ